MSQDKIDARKLRGKDTDLSLLIQQVPVSIAMFDREMRYLAASNRWKLDYNIPMGIGIIGRSHYEIFPEIPERWKEVHRRGLAGESISADEDPFERADGSTQWVKWDLQPWYNLEGHVGGILIAAEDVTERVLAKMALQESDRRKNEFLAVLAHELRNPLASIRYAAQVLRLIGTDEAVLNRVGSIIDQQVGQLARLVDDLLDISRISSGRIRLQKKILDVAEVIRQAIEMNRLFLDAREQYLNVTMPSKTVHLEGDFARLVQVVGNLINNAAKYTGHGGTISVTTEQGDGRPDTKDTVLIRVRDNGRGIDPKSLKTLCDIFYQESRNLDRSDGGLGLGLSLVKSLVELHGGWVEARSAGLGAGSEFTVCLPCLPQEPPVAHEDADRSLRTIGRHRILLVEDNIDVADSMTLLLKLYGQEVTLARNGQEAVEMALRERPDAVLMDIGLPFVDGYQACRAMRSEGLTDLLIVAVTGYGQESDKQKAAEAGFDQHMTKPLEAQAIMQLLASLPAMH
jgi:PAS domain S-box-containing protein